MSGTKSPRRRKWTCDACGKTDYWDENWSYYGSIGHMETCTDDLICSCCDSCRDIANAKIESKEWQLPVLRSTGPAGMGVVTPRKGY
jgi:hypothetical protein